MIEVGFNSCLSSRAKMFVWRIVVGNLGTCLLGNEAEEDFLVVCVSFSNTFKPLAYLVFSINA